MLATYGRIALLSPEGDVFDQMAGRYNQAAGPNLGVYLKGHDGSVDGRDIQPSGSPAITLGQPSARDQFWRLWDWSASQHLANIRSCSP